MSRRRGQRENPFEEPRNSVVEGADEIFGKSAPSLKTRNINARLIGLDYITTDPKQPRRGIPLRIVKQAQRDRKVTSITGALDLWHRDVEAELGYPIDIVGMIEGEDDIPEQTSDNPIIDDFYALISLAASIRREGLTNPITVYRLHRNSQQYIVETGERRFLSYNLLNMYEQGDNWASIPARVVDESDVWRQASENGARRPLNAIGMTRQLALLIMDMYAGEHQFKEYNDATRESGDSDRPFYAQTSELRIKRGMSQKILDATGLKSGDQISQYRKLLMLPDDLWLQADLNNWTQNYCRQFWEKRSNNRDNPTTVGLSPQNEGQNSPKTPEKGYTGQNEASVPVRPDVPEMGSDNGVWVKDAPDSYGGYPVEVTPPPVQSPYQESPQPPSRPSAPVTPPPSEMGYGEGDVVNNGLSVVPYLQQAQFEDKGQLVTMLHFLEAYYEKEGDHDALTALRKFLNFSPSTLSEELDTVSKEVFNEWLHSQLHKFMDGVGEILFNGMNNYYNLVATEADRLNNEHDA